MLTSHETQSDFEIFYKGLKDECNNLDIEIDLNNVLLMQDACSASKNAVKKLWPGVKLLMCYFHVKKNVRENKFNIHFLSKKSDSFPKKSKKF